MTRSDRVCVALALALPCSVLAACGGGAAPAPQAPQPPPAAATAHEGHAHGGHAHDKHAHDKHAHEKHAHDKHTGGEHHGEMPHRFENAEEWAKHFDDPARDEWQQPDRVIGALALSPEMTVADVGAGTGYFAVRLARAVPRGQVIATDVEPDMIRYLTERARREGLANVRAVETPPDSPRLGKASVDRVLVVNVWHHLGDRVAYARQLAEALRPGGFVAVVDYKLDARRGPPPKHRLAPDAIAADLRAAGLKAEVAAVDLPEQYIVIARR